MNTELLQKLADYEDLTVDELLEESVMDSVNCGICTNCEAYVEPVEPDCTNGWCEECKTNSVQSALVLAGIIQFDNFGGGIL